MRLPTRVRCDDRHRGYPIVFIIFIRELGALATDLPRDA